ncbi:unnamed protein product [Gongylonema pulchrum]|uniref:G_PROTEIN_RECEP_F1_2 domain-containing protein n=1 Tax=Gongylonema pulchrum TaxID=637853 RepID=A0A183DZY5_9BILA|nr:unnamed protein product [Gongylonema pulchrum]
MYQKLSPMPHFLAALFATVACIIFALTTFGNLLVLCFKARVGRTNTTLLVWNLGLTDFLVGIIVLPLGAVHVILREWHFSRSLCRLWVAADVTFCTCSVVIITIVSIWCFSLSVLLATVKWDQPPTCLNSNVCFAGNEIRYLAHSVIFAFFIPASVTLTLYWRIYRLARNRQKALDSGFLMILGQNMNFLTNTLSEHAHLRVHYGRRTGMVEHQRRVLRTHERVAKTLGVVSCSFLFCWLPFFTLYIARYCNSMLNPIIYSFTVKEYKRTALKMVLPLWKIAHRCVPPLVRAPPEHLTSKFLRNGARAERFKPRVYAKRTVRIRVPTVQNSFKNRRQKSSDAKSEETTTTAVLNGTTSAEGNITLAKDWSSGVDGDTIEREEEVDQVIEDQQLIRAQNLGDDIPSRDTSKKNLPKPIISKKGKFNKAKPPSLLPVKEEEVFAQVTDL